MKFKPTPAKAHSGVAIFLLRRFERQGKILLAVICKYSDYWPISVIELTFSPEQNVAL
jgi:hypothetical protein